MPLDWTPIAHHLDRMNHIAGQLREDVAAIKTDPMLSTKAIVERVEERQQQAITEARQALAAVRHHRDAIVVPPPPTFEPAQWAQRQYLATVLPDEFAGVTTASHAVEVVAKLVAVGDAMQQMEAFRIGEKIVLAASPTAGDLERLAELRRQALPPAMQEADTVRQQLATLDQMLPTLDQQAERAALGDGLAFSVSVAVLRQAFTADVPAAA